MFLEQKPEWQIPDRHFCPATPSSGCRILHLYYSLLSLQQEIEKRTFYLGKYRTDENGNKPHLLDLIGMSRDEADILYPFAKSAMADVFDALNSSTIGMPKLYKWEGKKNAITIKSRIKSPISNKVIALTATAQKDYIKIAGTLNYTLQQNNTDVIQNIKNDYYRPNMTVVVNYKTTKDNIATNEQITTDYSIPVTLTSRHVSAGTTSGSQTVQVTHNISCYIPFCLQPQNNGYTKENLSGNMTISDEMLSEYLEYTKPERIPSGTHFTISNNPVAPKDTEYNAIAEFSENDLPTQLSSIAEIVEQGEIISEGIHYYFEFPDYFNESLIEPLDNAILEALVNRVIWHWLILSYPAEAATYDSLYQASIAALKTRSDIFQKHWATRTPRIL